MLQKSDQDYWKKKIKDTFFNSDCSSEPLQTDTIKCLPAKKIEGEMSVKTVLIACPILDL